MRKAISRLFGSNRAAIRDVLGNVVIGDVQGIVVQTIVNGPPPEPLRLPWRVPSRQDGALDIFNLLTWRSRLAETLVDRSDALSELLTWARSDQAHPIAIRFITGPGGAGKSRLAAEVADTLRQEGWSTGLVQLDKATTLPLNKGGLFAAIDYPEANQAAVRKLLRNAGSGDSFPGKVRIVLVSRQPMAWWQGEIIAAQASELCDAQDIVLGPVSSDHTIALVRQVANRLASLEGKAIPELDSASITDWYERNPALHGLPLIATAAAVHAVLTPGDTFTLAGSKIIEALVARERMRFDRAAESAGWPVAEAGSRLHALATLRAGLDEQTLKHVAAIASDIGLPSADRVIDRVRALGWWNNDRVQAPQPDLVASELLYQVLHQRPQAAPQWLAAVLCEISNREIEQLSRLMGDFAELHSDSSNQLTQWLADAVSTVPGLAMRWREILDSPVSSFWLAPLAIAIARDILSGSKLEDADRARLLNSLSVRLSYAGDRTEALAAAVEAASVYRRFIMENPGEADPEMAGILTNLSNRFRDVGDGATALMAAQEAVAIHRQIALDSPYLYQGDRAQSLNNLSNHLLAAGAFGEALNAIQEATSIFRHLAQTNPSIFEVDLGVSLNNLANCLRKTGDAAAALSIGEETSYLYRRLALTSPARFNQTFALSLINLSVAMSDVGSHRGAIDPISEAVEILRKLAENQPASYNSDLAMSLHNLASHLVRTGSEAEALVPIQEAAVLYRALAQATPDRFGPELADTLTSLSNRLNAAERNDEALSAIAEVIWIYRGLTVRNPASFLPLLALSLTNLSDQLHHDGQASLAAKKEAAEIYLSLAREDTESYNPDLGNCLYNLALDLKTAGDDATALSAMQEASSIYSRLAAAIPDLFEPDMAVILYTLSNYLSAAGNATDALATSQEAVDIYRRLSRALPYRYMPSLAASLIRLSICFAANTENRDSGLAAIQEAVKIYRTLDEREPGHYQTDIELCQDLLEGWNNCNGGNVWSQAGDK